MCSSWRLHLNPLRLYSCAALRTRTIMLPAQLCGPWHLRSSWRLRSSWCSHAAAQPTSGCRQQLLHSPSWWVREPSTAAGRASGAPMPARRPPAEQRKPCTIQDQKKSGRSAWPRLKDEDLPKVRTLISSAPQRVACVGGRKAHVHRYATRHSDL